MKERIIRCNLKHLGKAPFQSPEPEQYVESEMSLKSIGSKVPITYHWIDYCPSCKRNHRLVYKACPTCSVHETPQPVSNAVADKCHADYSCDGCMAYREHTNPY